VPTPTPPPLIQLSRKGRPLRAEHRRLFAPLQEAKMSESLLQALKLASQASEAMPLFKTGKQAGLFAARHEANAQAAERALAEGLLEVVRTESKGKTDVQWVRITVRGRQYLTHHESPRAVLEELAQLLRPHHDGLARWQEETRCQLLALTRRAEELLARQGELLAALAGRVETALRRLAAGPVGDRELSAWQLDLLHFVAEFSTSPRPSELTLSAALARLHQAHSSLTLPAFHEGLLQLRDRGTIELAPFEGNTADLPEPEFAILDEGRVYYAIRGPR